jgi:hypothetical protein
MSSEPPAVPAAQETGGPGKGSLPALLDRRPFNSPWVARMVGTFGLPVWFGMQSLSQLFLSADDLKYLYFDARLYLDATRAWLAGGNPWDVQLAGNYFAAPPPTLLPLAPFALLPPDAGVAVLAALVILSAVATIRLLHLPWWWILFPPLFQCMLSANVHAMLLPLILLKGGTIATLLKVYAAVPLAILGRWRALVMVVVVLVVTAPLLPWSMFLDDAAGITGRLAQQTKFALPTPLLILATPFAALAVLIVGRERGAWLAVPAVWPSQQYYYGALALGARSGIAAALVALPIQGSGLIALLVLAALEWRRGKRPDRMDWFQRR